MASASLRRTAVLENASVPSRAGVNRWTTKQPARANDFCLGKCPAQTLALASVAEIVFARTVSVWSANKKLYQRHRAPSLSAQILNGIRTIAGDTPTGGKMFAAAGKSVECTS